MLFERVLRLEDVGVTDGDFARLDVIGMVVTAFEIGLAMGQLVPRLEAVSEKEAA